MMHRILLGTTLLMGFAAGPVAADTATYGAGQSHQTPGYRSPGYQPPGYPLSGHEPMSSRASNIDQSDTRSTIAPSLPAPPVGQNAGPKQLLIAAQQAIAARRTGMAQEALERAESRLLDRSVPQGRTNEPADNGAAGQIEVARHALAAGDLVTASSTVQSVLSGLNHGSDYGPLGMSPREPRGEPTGHAMRQPTEDLEPIGPFGQPVAVHAPTQIQ
jgi:hypothetical protein